MPGSLEIDVFWSFRSPWSYLATARLREWQQVYDLQVNFRPVYPIAIRTPDFFSQVNPLWAPYLMKDVFRVAEFLGLPFVWPNPDPVNQGQKDGKLYTSDDQPHIKRLTFLGLLAEEMGKGIEFADEVSRLIWGGTENWHEGAHLSDAAGRAGLDLRQMDHQFETEEERLEALVIKNQQDHEAAGHWGVPTCVYKGEPFFGQDRLDVLLWRLKQQGLQARG